MNEVEACPDYVLQDDYIYESVSIPSPQSSSSMLVTSNSANVTPQASTSGQVNLGSRRGTKYPENIINATKVNFTVMFCGNAAGETVPPPVSQVC